MSQTRPKIAFLMSVYDGLDYTRGCLDSLKRTVDLTDHEVIIVDDLSTDGTREFLAMLPPPFRVVFNDRKRSFAANNNTAARLATGEVLCLLNNDLILTPGWLEPLLRALERFPDAGFVGNVHRNPRTGRYDHMGICFNREGGAKHFGMDFLFRPLRGYTQWPAVTAACCLINRQLFIEAGGFNEDFINCFEDLDLCLRLGQMGKKHYVANDSVVFHYVSATTSRFDHVAANAQRFFQRWRASLRPSFSWRDNWLYQTNNLLGRLQRRFRTPQERSASPTSSCVPHSCERS